MQAMEKAGCVEKEEEAAAAALPGFRFHPTDGELVGFYLRRKVEKKPTRIELIKQIDIYKYDPWDLPEVCNVGVKEKDWYFYCLRGRKYRNSIRPNRVTGSGFWKATGIDRPIYSDEEKTKDCIGLKKSLVYYRGSAGKGTKTDWMMHEFRLPTDVKNTNALNAKNTDEAEVWTICRIFQRTVSYKKFMPADWIKQQAKQQHPIDSSSKTCSFESDNREKYKCFDSAEPNWNEKKPVTKNIEPNDHIFSGQFSPMAQSTITTSYPTFPCSNTTEFAKEDNWDELGAMMGSLVDPAFIFGAGYS